MKYDMFETYLRELRGPGHYSLAAMVGISLIHEEHLVPLRFSRSSQIEYQGESSSHRELMSESWLMELMKRLTAEHDFIRMAEGSALRFAVSLKGELCFKGSGRDIDLIRSEDSRIDGLYFEVTHLTVTNAWSLLFQHPDHPVDMTSDVGPYIVASHEKVNAWMHTQHGFVIA